MKTHWPRTRFAHGLSLVLSGILVLLGSAKIRADEKVPPAADVFVPFDSTKPLDTQTPGKVFIDYKAFQRLWKEAKANRQVIQASGGEVAGQAPWAVIHSALYKARIVDAKLIVEGLLSVSSSGVWAQTEMGFAGASPSQIQLDGTPAPLREGKLLLEKPGQHTVEARFETALPSGWQKAQVSLPGATASLLELSLQDMSARITINGGLPTVELATVDGVVARHITAALGPAKTLTIERLLAATTANQAVKLPSMASIQSALYVSPALERLESHVEFSFPGGDRQEFRFDFDGGITPISFDIANLETWNLKHEGGRSTLDFKLALPVRDKLSISLTGERPAGKLPATEEFPTVNASAARQEQKLLLLAVNELDLKVQPTPAHQQTDFPDLKGADAGFQRVAAFSATGSPPPLPLTISGKELKHEAKVDYLLQVSPSKFEIHAVFGLNAAPGEDLLKGSVAVPPGFAVTRVDSDRLQDWWVDGDTLQVRFSGATPPTTTLLLGLAQPWKEVPSSLKFSPVAVQGFSEVKGRGMIAALPALNVKLAFDQRVVFIREVGSGEQTAEYPAIGAFQLAPPFEGKRSFTFDVAAFEATATLEQVTPQFDSRWVLGAEVHDSWTRLEARCDVEVHAGALSDVAFTLPVGAGEARVTGEAVREVTRSAPANQPLAEYRVSFQNPIVRATQFVVALELPHQGEISLPDIRFPGASLSDRFLMVQNASEGELHLDPGKTKAAEPMQSSDVAKEVHFTVEQFSAPQYFRLGDDWHLQWKLESLATTAGTKALVRLAELTTAVRANGEEWLRAVYRLHNRNLQFLPVRLPEGAELISITIAGEPVRADHGERDGRPVLLVPLIQTRPGDLDLDVDLVCRKPSTGETLPQQVGLKLDDPELPGVTIERTLWNVSVPPGYSLKDADGNMERVEEAAAEKEKLSSFWSELVGLNSLRQSREASAETKVLARRNAQNLRLVFESAAQTLGNEEAKKQVQQFDVVEQQLAQQEAAQKVQPDATPAAASTGNLHWSWDFNSSYMKDRNSTDQKRQQEELVRITSSLGLNDSCFCGNGALMTKYKAAPPASAPASGNQAQGLAQGMVNSRSQAVNRLQQANEGDKEVLGEQLKQLEANRLPQSQSQPQLSGGIGKGSSHEPQQAAQLPVSKSARDLSLNYQNAWNRNNDAGAMAQADLVQRLQGIENGRKLESLADGLENEGDFNGAVGQLNQALNTLPASEATATERRRLVSKWGDASVKAAERFAKQGQSEKAREMVQAVLAKDRDPQNSAAQALLRDLNDSEASKSEHGRGDDSKKDQDAKSQFNVARGHFDLGQYDDAAKVLTQLLAQDPANPAVRRYLEKTQQELETYTQASRDHSRLRMVRGVNSAWESDGPAAVSAPRSGGLRPAGRVSLPVVFATPGETWHFKKVKDQAHLTISASRGLDLNRRWQAGAWLAGSLLVLLLVDRWWRRRQRRRAIRHQAKVATA